MPPEPARCQAKDKALAGDQTLKAWDRPEGGTFHHHPDGAVGQQNHEKCLTEQYWDA